MGSSQFTCGIAHWPLLGITLYQPVAMCADQLRLMGYRLHVLSQGTFKRIASLSLAATVPQALCVSQRRSETKETRYSFKNESDPFRGEEENLREIFLEWFWWKNVYFCLYWKNNRAKRGSLDSVVSIHLIAQVQTSHSSYSGRSGQFERCLRSPLRGHDFRSSELVLEELLGCSLWIFHRWRFNQFGSRLCLNAQYLWARRNRATWILCGRNPGLGP